MQISTGKMCVPSLVVHCRFSADGGMLQNEVLLNNTLKTLSHLYGGARRQGGPLSPNVRFPLVERLCVCARSDIRECVFVFVFVVRRRRNLQRIMCS